MHQAQGPGGLISYVATTVPGRCAQWTASFPPERDLQQWLWRLTPVITAIRRLRHKDLELEASLSYTGRP